ncbi:peptidase S8/S53 domain-containing protein [Annulohypoxylon maeteangense]|uniref:peptidase S8/S53 domain-containing protein n=1 Tax=Annulohypoxylon maeteangense TaxID=1927788 RepID=UPI002008D126|nr:peptidase S8/S53 domain-containing protein [Annulohypoxylon maeteangense]KAI0888574.1 peptidase S8/S53 domain-containing protein [Annulohypoxylon maeteangense]
MCSCVGGTFAGSFKQANIVPVRILKNSNTAPFLDDIVNAIAWVINDKANSKVGAGVMSMSFGFPISALKVANSQEVNTVDPFADIFDRIGPAGIVAVASAGNDADDDMFNRTPRRNGGRDTPMIVVGAADITSQKCDFSSFKDSTQNGILSIYAVGKDVVCGGRKAFDNYARNTGSSPATAQVAGIVAMYLAKQQTTVANAKAYLLSEAVRLKGANWPNDGAGGQPGPGPPRAGVGYQIPCTGGGQTATQPSYEEPDRDLFAELIREEEISEYNDPDFDVSYLSPIFDDTEYPC